MTDPPSPREIIFSDQKFAAPEFLQEYLVEQSFDFSVSLRVGDLADKKVLSHELGQNKVLKRISKLRRLYIQQRTIAQCRDRSEVYKIRNTAADFVNS